MMKMKMKMCALFVILALVSQHASGVEVFEGEESVLLPCNMVVPKDHAVVWKREDLSSAIVHAIVEGKDDLLNQNTRYSNRTSMSADALQTGDLINQNARYSNRTSMSADALQTRDLSLTLRKPTFTDSGTYACVTRKHGADQQRTEVQLKVKVGQLTPLEVTEGAPSVLLPYTHTCCLGEVVKVEWIFVTHENKKVCVFENGQIKRDQQHTDYRERAEMESFPPKEEKTDQLNRPEVDLSLTLRNPVCADGGVYLCILHDRAVNTMKLKLVPLLVKEPLMTTVRAAVGGRNKAAKRLPSFRVSKDAAVEAECAAGGQKALHGGALG
ncbi:uncharacterized protein LOC120742271 isoform X6 [Simochromis diagramma]|uniref:uncharacterized protein LOC120742271 isoform X6 n=1 Tax=Simochromis diagramma TaxID=43689 RepID=UPI001A7E65CB|nr:uncharacterized protein LOC120742271 isoform X6 [Simochromis diagramma]